MRMLRLFVARLEPKLEHAHFFIFEQHFVELWRRFHRVLPKDGSSYANGRQQWNQNDRFHRLAGVYSRHAPRAKLVAA